MKTREFIKAVEELGYLVDNGYGYWQIWSAKNPILAAVNKIDLFRISTDFVAWCNIPDEDKSKLLDLIVEFAKTPIEDREEEKRFYLRHKWIKIIGHNSKTFLNYHNEEDKFYLYTIDESSYVKTQFTEKEIEEIKKKFDTDLKDFELVEVEE